MLVWYKGRDSVDESADEGARGRRGHRGCRMILRRGICLRSRWRRTSQRCVEVAFGVITISNIPTIVCQTPLAALGPPSFTTLDLLQHEKTYAFQWLNTSWAAHRAVRRGSGLTCTLTCIHLSPSCLKFVLVWLRVSLMPPHLQNGMLKLEIKSIVICAQACGQHSIGWVPEQLIIIDSSNSTVIRNFNFQPPFKNIPLTVATRHRTCARTAYYKGWDSGALWVGGSSIFRSIVSRQLSLFYSRNKSLCFLLCLLHLCCPARSNQEQMNVHFFIQMKVHLFSFWLIRCQEIFRQRL